MIRSRFQRECEREYTLGCIILFALTMVISISIVGFM